MCKITEHKVGEKFKFGFLTYEVRESLSCTGCWFRTTTSSCKALKLRKYQSLESCTMTDRQDKTSVIFVKIE